MNAWVHQDDAAKEIRAVAEAARHTYPVFPPTTITVRRATAADGCWCYAHGRFPRVPHPHEPRLGGCPVTPAFDNYVWLAISRADEVGAQQDVRLRVCGGRDTDT